MTLSMILLKHYQNQEWNFGKNQWKSYKILENCQIFQLVEKWQAVKDSYYQVSTKSKKPRKDMLKNHLWISKKCGP